MIDGQGVEEDALGDGEDRSVGADAHGERQDGNAGEQRVAQELAAGEA